MENVWLALLSTNLSEKCSIVRLLEMANDIIQNEFPSDNINLKDDDRSVDLALTLMPATAKPLTPDEIEAGRRRLRQDIETNARVHDEILHEILDTVRHGSFHWRYGLMASEMIYNLVHTPAKVRVPIRFRDCGKSQYLRLSFRSTRTSRQREEIITSLVRRISTFVSGSLFPK